MRLTTKAGRDVESFRNLGTLFKRCIYKTGIRPNNDGYVTWTLRMEEQHSLEVRKRKAIRKIFDGEQVGKKKQPKNISCFRRTKYCRSR